MSTKFPNDADGDALQNLVDHGSDLSRPLLINFQVAVPSQESADAFAKVVCKLGYKVSIYESPECALPWTCECSTRAIATYDALIAYQKELAVLATPFGGHPDGWGSFGNKDD